LTPTDRSDVTELKVLYSDEKLFTSEDDSELPLKFNSLFLAPRSLACCLLPQVAQKMTPESVSCYEIQSITSVDHWFSNVVPHFPVGVPCGCYVTADKGKFVSNFMYNKLY